MQRRADSQLFLALPARAGWGGRRPGAGRPPGPRPPVPHTRRPVFAAAHPAHVTLRLRPGLPSLRSPRLVRLLERSLLRAPARPDFRLVHYSLQSNHAHLVVEAAGPTALGRGVKALGTRLARAVHRAFGCRGPVLAERYHLRVLRTPREVRDVLRYVLLNAGMIDVSFDLSYVGVGSVTGSFVVPAGAYAGADGWKVNKATLVKYMNVLARRSASAPAARRARPARRRSTGAEAPSTLCSATRERSARRRPGAA